MNTLIKAPIASADNLNVKIVEGMTCHIHSKCYKEYTRKGMIIEEGDILRRTLISQLSVLHVLKNWTLKKLKSILEIKFIKSLRWKCLILKKHNS